MPQANAFRSDALLGELTRCCAGSGAGERTSASLRRGPLHATLVLGYTLRKSAACGGSVLVVRAVAWTDAAQQSDVVQTREGLERTSSRTQAGFCRVFC